MSNALYKALEAANRDSDEADRQERLVGDQYGYDSEEYFAASYAASKAFTEFQRARDDYDAVQVTDPMDDFNYVGSRHHY